jgi:hypothetical protein
MAYRTINTLPQLLLQTHTTPVISGKNASQGVFKPPKTPLLTIFIKNQ